MYKERDDLISLEEAEKGIEIISKICGIDKEKINYPTVECNGLSISKHNFEFFPRELLFTDFQYEIKFIECKFGCLECFDLYETKNSFLIFENCIFDYICLNNDLVTGNAFELNNKLYFFGCKFNEDIDIGKANINGEIKFNGCIFKDVFYFGIKEYLANIKIKNCIFYKSFFMSGSFKNEARFDNSIFKDYVNFHECEFEKTACFYGVVFDKTPNFSQAIFKGNLNVVNTNLNFTFDDLQEKIKQEYEDCNKDKEEQDKKPLDKFANDFRDSFRTFKSALIKDNNLIDASNFHKYELYCKEIELKQNWNQRGKNVESMADVEKNIWRIRDLVDFLLLGFYRKLCDHHTDFLKVFNNLILLVALYALFIFLIGYKIEPYKTNIYNSDFSKLNLLVEIKNKVINSPFMQNYYGCILVFFCILCIASIVIRFYYIFKNIKINFKIIKNIVLKDMLINMINLFIYLFFSLVILIYINIYIPNNLYAISNIGIFFAFCIFYLWIVCLNSLFLRYCLVCISYIVAIIAMGYSIAILNPFIGKLIDDKIFLNDSLFIYLTFAYTILMFLVLFSLQKTARKNSIVPS